MRAVTGSDEKTTGSVGMATRSYGWGGTSGIGGWPSAAAVTTESGSFVLGVTTAAVNRPKIVPTAMLIPASCAVLISSPNPTTTFMIAITAAWVFAGWVLIRLTMAFTAPTLPREQDDDPDDRRHRGDQREQERP